MNRLSNLEDVISLITILFVKRHFFKKVTFYENGLVQYNQCLQDSIGGPEIFVVF